MKKIASFCSLDTYCVNTVVLGSGAAGFSAADLLYKKGVKDLVLVSEGVKAGTSRNTGSDKQTYYKLSLSGEDKDSVRAMARDLYNGRAVDGDIALVEASLSVPSFMRLVELGVPFPQNRYGEYVGYKTDHDPYKRATSAGPYTSKFMTECLEKEVKKDGIEILDGEMAIRILTHNDEIRGLIVINRKSGKPSIIFTHSLVLATGGPAGIYRDSVYPLSQFGASGIAFEAGCMGKNLNEWQYGMASLKPRWNVSGSYMQVMPRFVSIDKNGKEYDFLSTYPKSREEMLGLIFLKGYQWPFDVRKLESGSSIIDILCLLEKEKGRRVFLDYMHNPDFLPIEWDKIPSEAYSYLSSSSALLDTPYERLKVLNAPAIDFYLKNGVDLSKEYLEIGISAQHNNGGLSVNLWWESNIKGIFPIGECSCTHGVYRPGGSALNAGQVGARRASDFISSHRSNDWLLDTTGLEETVNETISLINNAYTGNRKVRDVYDRIKDNMSRNASLLREKGALLSSLQEVEEYLEDFSSIYIDRPTELWLYFELRNALLTQKVYLSSMIDYLENGGKSRGSALYTDKRGKVKIETLDNRFTYTLEDEKEEAKIEEVELKKGKVYASFRSPRPLIESDDFFENVWREYRENKNIY